jgi:AmmeMemoRadiSam system protein B
VAGQFYPGRKTALVETLAKLLPAVSDKQPAFAVMSPHAGYVYSGSVAGRTFAAVAIPAEVVILGPNHHGYGHPLAVYPCGEWDLPLGKVPIAAELTGAILAACPQTGADSTAHRFEHSLEVQVPFLQSLAPELAIAALCIGRADLATLLALGDGLAVALRTRPVRPLLVASTDMTHYESGETARRKDLLALQHVLALDPEGLYRTVSDQHISMCGVLPTVVMLRAALALGARRAELVAYANSGEVTGDQSEVVGYAGVIVT